MTTPKKNTWFPPKKNGWGWGKPHTWQGWAVLAVYFLAVVMICFIYDPKIELISWAIWVGSMTLVLLVVYVVKGDSPSWKWKAIKKKRRFK